MSYCNIKSGVGACIGNGVNKGDVSETSSKFGLYLYYSFKIEPFDDEAVQIKKNFDVEQVIKRQKVLKNDEVKTHFKNIGQFCAISTEPFIDTYYVELEHNEHTISSLLYKVNNIELITSNMINTLETKNIMTAIHRTINLNNNLLSEHDKYFNYELENIVKTLSIPRYYNLSKIYIEDTDEQPFNMDKKISSKYLIDEILKIPLFDYQRDNINWMLELEENPVYEYISADKLLFFPDGRIYNYTKNCFTSNSEREHVKLRGGIIMDNVGIGKTFQLLCLAMSKVNINTIILVPDHLESHWINQFNKHFSIEMPTFIKIVKFSKFRDYNINQVNRLIVDEIHELYSNHEYKNILEACFKTDCTYKWGITATPFPVPNSIYNILRFLTEKDLYYQNLDRFNYFYDTYYKIFRKNTLENIVKEVKLPNAIEYNILLEFNDQERIFYDAETMAHDNCDEYFLRKCCCDVMINFKNNTNNITLAEFNNLVIDDYKYKYTEEKEKLDKYIEFYNNCLILLEKISSSDDNTNEEEINEMLKKTDKNELIQNINHYKNKIDEQQVITANRKQAHDYLYNKINEINKQCPMCLEEITNIKKYDVPECGHICCSECMGFWLSTRSTCAMCKKTVQKDKMYTITNLDQVKLKYSTKIDKLLEIIGQSNEKFIVYTQFDNLISKLHLTLNNERIGCIKFVDPSQIDEFKNNASKQVLIISSIKNASGIDLSFVSNIIIFEPIIGNILFLKDIEKQIIGRIYRINQLKDINIYRFIIKDTIEEEIFNKIYN